MNRGEIWLADLGYVGKVRRVLILSVEPGDEDRALVTYVIRTTSARGTAYEVPHPARGMKPGVFDAQGMNPNGIPYSSPGLAQPRVGGCMF